MFWNFLSENQFYILYSARGKEMLASRDDAKERLQALQQVQLQSVQHLGE
jgi:hypothetical protein